MKSEEGATQANLNFPLEVQDGWPPVAVECLSFRIIPGGLELTDPPLFVKDLSVGDVITAELGDEDSISSWEHLVRSSRTTVWLLRLKRPADEIEASLAALRSLGCNSVSLSSYGVHAVDVPEEVSMEDVDKVLDQLDSESVGVAFPSFRHPD